jgi:hypothetical protein
MKVWKCPVIVTRMRMGNGRVFLIQSRRFVGLTVYPALQGEQPEAGTIVL